MTVLGGYTPIQRLASIIGSMNSNIGGRGVTAKAFSVGAVSEEAFPEERLQVIIHSYERDVQQARNIENQLKAVFDQTIEKIAEQYEEEYLESVELVQEGTEEVVNDILGFGCSTQGTGAFAGSAQETVRSYMVRIIRTYKVENNVVEQVDESVQAPAEPVVSEAQETDTMGLLDVLSTWELN